jgi:hypothetical protein
MYYLPPKIPLGHARPEPGVCVNKNGWLRHEDEGLPPCCVEGTWVGIAGADAAFRLLRALCKRSSLEGGGQYDTAGEGGTGV